MKRHLNKILLVAGVGLSVLSSCNKDNSPVYFNGGTAPVLTSTATDSISLPVTDTTATAVTFSWTNPNYQFSDGISSLNVSYLLEIDTVSDFSSQNMAQVGISNQLSITYTVAQLNAILSNQMGLAANMQHNIVVRVVSYLAPLSPGTPRQESTPSNSLNFTVTPYLPPPAVNPPASGALWITGSATNDGWMAGGNPGSVAGQQLTQVTPLIYTITLPLIGGQQFLLVPVAGDWSNKYATSNANSSPTGGTFAYDASNNFNGPTTSGTYKVTFYFQSGTYTIVAQ
ncbi:MAG TPA: SusE domain-containing protein [Puia sp.]|nr:SusE domain-containing protein [Puia sp.]